ncbi:protein lifeguard 1-like [Yasminevirus sp. GU-2018]|uniref:Protein lifeguard 1-like n=1 Tax=Yasminevirus sp. GU-2018 TaxID=2420051 RepID=A0A5K0U966_9VIRU|nr:protein lifeguard 1-like [Yasminevirus sp. GU-2018]
MFTVGVVLMFISSDSVRQFVQSTPALVWGSFAGAILFMCVISCCTSFARTSPWNILLLIGETLTQSYLVGVFSSYYDTHDLIVAILLTVFIVVSLTMFSCQSRYDFNRAETYIFAGVLIAVGFGFMSIILCTAMTCNGVSLLFSLLWVIVFSMYLIYDTQRVINGTHPRRFANNEYVFAAISLYLDVISIFACFLNSSGGGSSNEGS